MAPSSKAVTAARNISLPATTPIRWNDTLFRGGIILLAVLWIYSPAYHGDWLWDDDQLLTQNPVVQHRLPTDPPNSPPRHLQSLAKLWLDPNGADFFPLSYTALWAQWPFFGTWSTGYHVTSILLHAVGSLLVWALLARMHVPGAWLSGLLFAIHPVCVESVAWVSETKNTLSLPLALAACLCWVAQDDDAEPADRRSRLYWLAIVFFLLAMFAKTSMVALPVVFLLHAWWKRDTVTAADVIKAAPFFLISIVLGIITINYQHGRAIGDETIPVGGIASRIATAGMAILFYLKQIVWPVDLLPIYPRWEVDPPKPWQFLAWPVIAAGAYWLWANRGTHERPGWGRHAILGLGFFLLMVAPVLGFVTISYMRITWVADHFIYLPMIGVIALVGAAAARWYERLDDRAARLALTAGAFLLAACGLFAFRYAHAWANEDALWTHTLRTNPDAWQAHNRLGARKFARGDVDGAFQHFTQSTRLRPDLGETHNNLGSALSAKGRIDDAIREFSEACRLTPKVPIMHMNLANALFQRGRFTEAADRFKLMLTEQPKNPMLLNNYAFCLLRAGDKAAAIEAFRQALAINPTMKEAREGLAIATGEQPAPQPSDQGQPPAPQPAAAAPPLPGQSTLGPPPLSSPAASPSFDPLQLQGK